MLGRPSLRSTFIVVSFLVTACTGPPSEERASLCEDLGNLTETVSLLAGPPEDATVGDIRGATEKLDPTIAQVEDAGVVPEAERVAFRAAQEAVLEALEHTGDETELSSLPPDLLAPVTALVGRYGAVVASLGCDDPDA